MRIFNRIHSRNLRGDIFGGVTAAIIALPMALAFGVASGAGAAAGLYGAVLVGLFAALFGGTPTLISEPTGPMTVVMTAIVAKLTASDPENGLAMAFTVVMLAGCFQILFGVLRLGKYVTLMPYTVISGFMSGIGIILIVLQIPPFLGHASPKGGVIGTLRNLPDLIAQTNLSEVALAALTIAVIFFWPNRFKRLVPPQLVALVVGIVVSLTLLSGADIRRIGEIPAGLPSLQMPVFSAEQLQIMFIDALVLGMLGCIDALLTSVIADSLTQTQHDSNKELIGQGLGNLASGLFGGLPGAGATMGTVVNIQTGGRTALSGITRAIILLVVVLLARELTQSIPLAVLAGIALKVGVDIIDWKFLRRAHKISLRATGIMYGVMLLTVFVDLITAVGIGVFVANILTIERLSKLQVDEVSAITNADNAAPLSQHETQLIEKVRDRILLLHLGGPMSFGAAKAISIAYQRQTAKDHYDILILDLSDVPLLGVTASLAIEKILDDAKARGLEVFLVGSDAKKVKERLKRLDILGRVPAHNRFSTRLEALEQAVSLLGGQSISTSQTDSEAFVKSNGIPLG